MTDKLQDEREQFEAWIVTNAALASVAEVLLKKFPNGDYHNQTTYSAWQAWQARAAIASDAEPVAIVEHKWLNGGRFGLGVKTEDLTILPIKAMADSGLLVGDKLFKAPPTVKQIEAAAYKRAAEIVRMKSPEMSCQLAADRIEALIPIEVTEQVERDAKAVELPTEKELLDFAEAEELFLFADQEDFLAIANAVLELVTNKLRLRQRKAKGLRDG